VQIAGGHIPLALGRSDGNQPGSTFEYRCCLSRPSDFTYLRHQEPRATLLGVAVTTTDPFGEAEGFSLNLAKQALHGNLDGVIETVKRNVGVV
jgi:hypothetical protein